MAVLQIPDFRLGGPDLRTEAGVQHVLTRITAAKISRHVVSHAAPPCGTCSHVRDRAKNARARYILHIRGLPNLKPDFQKVVEDGNALA